MAEQRKIVFCGVLTISDRCSAGVAEDTSGVNLQNLLQQFPGFKAIVKVRKIVPDEIPTIKNTLIDWVDKEKCNLILTTGGTGISPRDVTPEATAQVIERELTAVTTGIIAASLAKTRFSMLSRMKCGTRGKCFILNLPGSKPVAEECFKFVQPILQHAIDLLENDLDDVEAFHKIAGNSNTLRTSKAGDGPTNSANVSDTTPSQRSSNDTAEAVILENITDSVLLQSGPGAHGLSHSAHSLSHSVHGLSHATHGLSHAVHGLSHGMAHGLAHSNAHGLMHSTSHAQGLEAGDSDINGILSISEAELELEASELEKESLDIDNTSDATLRSMEKGNRRTFSIEKLIREKRRLNPEYTMPLPPTKLARRDRSSSYPLTPVDKAIEVMLKNTPVLPTITLSYEESSGHILAEDIKSPENVPAFLASIKDGYAVIAPDTPGTFDVIGSSIYGVYGPNEPLKRGQAIRITTGSPLPIGADAVVQVEDTKLIEEARQGELEIKISIATQAKVGQDIRPIGSDIKKGELVLKAGTLLGANEIGVLAAVGIVKVLVYRKPVVAVVSTGNELAEPGSSSLERGQVRDSNRITLLSALKAAGYQTIDLGIAPDDLGKLQLILEHALEKADVVISSGGVSMGEKDYLKTAIELLGGKIHFGRVFMKPGKPTTFATLDFAEKKKLLFALPGNPVSSVVTFNVFALSSLKRMSGHKEHSLTTIKARVSTTIKLDARPEYQRCTVTWKPGDGTPWAYSTGNQISSRLTSMVAANALLVLPQRQDDCTEICSGELVDALIIDKL